MHACACRVAVDIDGVDRDAERRGDIDELKQFRNLSGSVESEPTVHIAADGLERRTEEPVSSSSAAAVVSPLAGVLVLRRRRTSTSST